MRLVMIVRAFGAGVLLLSALCCSKSTPSDAPPATAPPPAAAPAVQMGSVAGTAPAGAIVVLDPKTPREFPPGETPIMDQVSLTFTPDVLLVRTGHPVEFRNSDDTLHNVHVGNVETKEPSFNVAIPTGEAYKYTFGKDGFYHVGCDIHPAMSAEILSVSTPYAARADTAGRFVLEDVAPGPYVLRVYAAGKKLEREMDVKNGANEIAFAPSGS
jgi:hypothetical protein